MTAATTSTCNYVMVWKDPNTDERTRWQCNENIDPERIAPYRQEHGVCHRHERGLAGWTPGNRGAATQIY